MGQIENRYIKRNQYLSNFSTYQLIGQGLWDSLYTKLQTWLTAESPSAAVPPLVLGGLPRPRGAGAGARLSKYINIYKYMLSVYTVYLSY